MAAEVDRVEAYAALADAVAAGDADLARERASDLLGCGDREPRRRDRPDAGAGAMSEPAVEQLAQQRLAVAERRLGTHGRGHPGRDRPGVLALPVAVDHQRLPGRAPSPRGWWSAAGPGPTCSRRWCSSSLFPVVEWLIHVFILHWRPRRVAGVEVDTLLARDHRRHHADPRDVPLVFIPWRALLWVVALPGLALPLGVGAWSARSCRWRCRSC